MNTQTLPKQYLIRDTDEETYCLPCAKKLRITGPVEVLQEEIGWPLSRCSNCQSLAESYCTCGRRPAVISSGGRGCRCRKPIAAR